MEQWVTMRDAAKAVGKSQATLTRLVAKGVISTKADPTDGRVKLVNLDEVKRLYAVRSKPEQE